MTQPHSLPPHVQGALEGAIQKTAFLSPKCEDLTRFLFPYFWDKQRDRAWAEYLAKSLKGGVNDFVFEIQSDPARQRDDFYDYLYSNKITELDRIANRAFGETISAVCAMEAIGRLRVESDEKTALAQPALEVLPKETGGKLLSVSSSIERFLADRKVSVLVALVGVVVVASAVGALHFGVLTMDEIIQIIEAWRGQ